MYSSFIKGAPVLGLTLALNMNMNLCGFSSSVRVSYPRWLYLCSWISYTLGYNYRPLNFRKIYLGIAQRLGRVVKSIQESIQGEGISH